MFNMSTVSVQACYRLAALQKKSVVENVHEQDNILLVDAQTCSWKNCTKNLECQGRVGEDS